MMLKKKFVLLLVLQVFFSCDRYPQDTYNTFEEVKNGVLLAGYAENPPWVYSSAGGPAGIEVQLIEGFARSLDARVQWVEMNEQGLLAELEPRNLHVVVSGLTKDSPWTSKVPVTGSFVEHEGKKHVIAVPPGEHRFLLELETFINKNKLDLKSMLQDYLLEENIQLEE